MKKSKLKTVIYCVYQIICNPKPFAIKPEIIHSAWFRFCPIDIALYIIPYDNNGYVGIEFIWRQTKRIWRWEFSIYKG